MSKQMSTMNAKQHFHAIPGSIGEYHIVYLFKNGGGTISKPKTINEIITWDSPLSPPTREVKQMMFEYFRFKKN